MSMYARIDDDTATPSRPPRLYWDGTRWWDLRDPDPALLAQLGWHQIQETPRPDDTPEGTHDLGYQVIDGVPTQAWTFRPWTPTEQAQQAQLSDLAERVARLEAHVWPPQPDPVTPDAPDWASYGGVVPAGGLLLDEGKVWRNVSGVPLVHPPSGFPGWTEAQLSHLWAVVLGDPDPEPEPEPDPTYPQWRGEWSAEATYVVGDHVTRGGIVYRCLVTHGPEYQGTWGPGPGLESVWQRVHP